MTELTLMHKRPGRSVALALFLAVALSSGRIAAQDRPVLSLDKAVEMALQADAQVLAARNDLEKAKLGEKQGVLATLPQITFEGEQSYTLDARTKLQNYTIKIKETLPTGVHLYGEGVAADAEVSRWDRERNEKEYQIRRAEVKEEILALFMSEAVLLSLTGGIIGIILGWALSGLVARLSGMPMAVTMPSILVSFSFALAIGLFFGVYPAYKAAGLNPIEALRHE